MAEKAPPTDSLTLENDFARLGVMYNRLAHLGFTLDAEATRNTIYGARIPSGDSEHSHPQQIYTRDARGAAPRLELRITAFPSGENVAINSAPEKEENHAHTGSPIPTDRVVPWVEKYLQQHGF